MALIQFHYGIGYNILYFLFLILILFDLNVSRLGIFLIVTPLDNFFLFLVFISFDGMRCLTLFFVQSVSHLWYIWQGVYYTISGNCRLICWDIWPAWWYLWCILILFFHHGNFFPLNFFWKLAKEFLYAYHSNIIYQIKL